VKLREYRTLAIRLEVNLTALHSSGEYAGSRKEFQVSLHGARPMPYCLDDPALVESLVRAPEKQGKYPLPCLPEEGLSEQAF
jgi:hypothetical protein